MLSDMCADVFPKDGNRARKARERVNRFVPELYLKAQELDEHAERERKKKVKKRWSKATLAASFITTRERDFEHSAPLLAFRPLKETFDGAVPSEPWGRQRCPETSVVPPAPPRLRDPGGGVPGVDGFPDPGEPPKTSRTAALVHVRGGHEDC